MFRDKGTQLISTYLFQEVSKKNSKTTGLHPNSPDHEHALLKSLDNEAFQTWAKRFPKAAKTLKHRMYQYPQQNYNQQNR